MPLPEPSAPEALGLVDRLTAGVASVPAALTRPGARQKARRAFDTLVAASSPPITSLLAAGDGVDVWTE